MILARKSIKIPEFLWYLPEKLTQIAEFYMTFCPENARILHNKCNNYFPRFILFFHLLFFFFFFFFLGGGGDVSSLPPVSYAYVYQKCKSL